MNFTFSHLSLFNRKFKCFWCVFFRFSEINLSVYYNIPFGLAQLFPKASLEDCLCQEPHHYPSHQGAKMSNPVSYHLLLIMKSLLFSFYMVTW